MIGNNNFPLVSIGVLSYNNAQFILETLDSIASQTYKNIELIINDDNSQDDSVNLIEDWIKRNDAINVKFFKQNINQGLCKSANRILQNANGKYINIIASDDYFLPDFIKKRVEFLENTDDSVGLCYSWTKIIYEDGRNPLLEKREKSPSGYLFDHITEGYSSLCKPLTILVKREVFQTVGYYDEELIYEDLDWFLRASKKYRFLFFDSYDTVYRERSGTLGTKIYTTEKGILSQLKIIEKNIGYSPVGDKNLDKRLRKLILISYLSYPKVAAQISKKRLSKFPSMESCALHALLKVVGPLLKVRKKFNK